MRPEHPLAREKQVTFSECAVHPVILPTEELSIYTVLLPHLTRFAGKMQVVAEVGSMDLMKNLTLKLSAISFQSRLGIEAELKSRRLIHVPLQSSGPVTTDLGIYVRRGRTFPPPLDAFVTLVREQLGELEKRSSDCAATSPLAAVTRRHCGAPNWCGVRRARAHLLYDIVGPRVLHGWPDLFCKWLAGSGPRRFSGTYRQRSTLGNAACCFL